MFDLVIKNGLIIDGTGNPWYRGDLGVLDGRIAEIGSIHGEHHERILNVKKLVVSPGFIDAHGHSDLYVFKDPMLTHKLLQGVTSDVLGNCGFSPAPVTRFNADGLKKSMEVLFFDVSVNWTWSTFGEYLKALDDLMPAVNLIPLVGHIPIRTAVMGFESRHPSMSEFEDMKALLSSSLEEGAFGMSAGLTLPPSSYADDTELIEFGTVIKKHNRIFTFHKRDYGDRAVESLEEVVQIGRESGARVHVSHNSLIFERNWDKIDKVLEVMERARKEEGVEITADHYPYTAGCGQMTQLIPDWAQSGGTGAMLERLEDEKEREKIIWDYFEGRHLFRIKDLEGIVIARVEKNKSLEGMKLLDAAREKGKDVLEFIFDLLIEEEAKVLILSFLKSEEENRRMMQHYTTMICSDDVPAKIPPHPRSTGTFPRVLGKLARDEGDFTIFEAVRKMTALPAQTFGLTDRGVIKKGMVADLTIFNPRTVADRSTFTDTHLPPEGISYVIVGGEIAMKDGRPTGIRKGKVLKPLN